MRMWLPLVDALRTLVLAPTPDVLETFNRVRMPSHHSDPSRHVMKRFGWHAGVVG
jgi:hypothetical protein